LQNEADADNALLDWYVMALATGIPSFESLAKTICTQTAKGAKMSNQGFRSNAGTAMDAITNGVLLPSGSFL